VLGDSFDASITVSDDGTHLEATDVTQGWTETFDGPTFEARRVGFGAVTGSSADRRSASLRKQNRCHKYERTDHGHDPPSPMG